MQATAYTYDPGTRCGSVLLDDGTPLPFDAAAFDAGGLRLLRPGQRVRIRTEGEGARRPGGLRDPSDLPRPGRRGDRGPAPERARAGLPSVWEPGPARCR